MKYVWAVELAILVLLDNPRLKSEVNAESSEPTNPIFSLAYNAQNFVRERLGLEYIGMTSTDFFRTYSSKVLTRKDKTQFWTKLKDEHNDDFLLL